MGTACADDALHLESGRFISEASADDDGASSDDGNDEDDADGRDGKKHLKMPSACHFVALVKLIHTSIRPGLLSAGSRRSTWLVVAKRSLSEMTKINFKRNEEHDCSNGLTGLLLPQPHPGCSVGHSSSVLSHHLLRLQPWFALY